MPWGWIWSTTRVGCHAEGATRTALKFWQDNLPADAREDVRRATHVINKGDVGLHEREQHFAQWGAKLTPEVMAGLARGEMLLPIGPDDRSNWER